jgi:hypothetical protein
MREDILERSNRVLLQVEASTGAIVYFSYDWTEIPEYPEVLIDESETVQDTAVDYLQNRGITTATLGYPVLIFDAAWLPDIGYTGSVYWYVSVDGGAIYELRISPISGEVLDALGTVTTSAPTATAGTSPATIPAALEPLLLGPLFIIPLSSFCLGLAGYLIVKNRQSKRLLVRYE